MRVTSSPSPDFIPALAVENLTQETGSIMGKFLGAKGETFEIIDIA